MILVVLVALYGNVAVLDFLDCNNGTNSATMERRKISTLSLT